MSISVLIFGVVLLAVLRLWFLAFPHAQVRAVWLKISLLAVLGAVVGFAWWTEPPDSMAPPLRIAPVIAVLAVVTIFMLPRGVLDEKQRKGVVEMLDTLVIAGATALMLIMFVVRPFFIPSVSMVPTLKVDDMVLVDELAYRFWTPGRGDIIVFRPPTEAQMGDKDLIKRVVAVGGDTVEIRNEKLIVNGQPVDEPYLNAEGPFGMGGLGLLKIPPGRLFCMGDNRGNSDDSRFWGTLPVENVIGKAFFIFWPPSRVGRLR